MRPSNRHTTTDEPAWHDQAACRGLDASIFYPADDDEEAIAVAKAVCAQCPVAAACLEHALDVREKNGVWGGCTERDRRRIVRQRRRGLRSAPDPTAPDPTAPDPTRTAFRGERSSDDAGSVLTALSR